MRLRPGVRFADGAPLNGFAVLANVERWQASASGRELLGETLADAPRPDLVRFILAAPDPGFPERLASPRLGLVSPRALESAAGAPLEPSEAERSGTGPFELRERRRDRLLLAHNPDWWGADRGLGPGLDQLEFVVVARAAERADRLLEGTIQVAGGLGADELALLRRDPLLTVIGRDAATLAIERSVRGIPPGEPAPSLNAVWRTSIGAGG